MERIKKNRVKFGRIIDGTEVPHFLDHQRKSYEDFLQSNVSSKKRENKGLEKILRDFFPIVSAYGNLKLEYSEYKLEESEFPLNNEAECRKRSKTFSITLKAKLRVVNGEGEKTQESWVYFCDVPLMTARGTFIINGTERVVVSQLHRSPGVFFSRETNPISGKDEFNAKIIPYKGTWLEVETNKDETLHVKIDKKKKLSLTTFLKALDFFKDNDDLCKTFFELKKVKMDSDARENIIGNFSSEDIINTKTGELVLEKGSYITKEIFDQIAELDLKELKIYEVDEDRQIFANTIREDSTKGYKDASIELFKKIRINDIATPEGAKNFVKTTFFDTDRYSLSDVGRYKLNARLGMSSKEEVLIKEDFIKIIEYLFKLRSNLGKLDDINSLSNRRVRGVGELLSMQFRSGLARIERNAKEKMAMSDPYTVTPQSLLNTKFLYSVVIDFFASGQLSQFMDQTNPLSELTHKRRISSLGPGGLTRDRATFDVRDVHSSHYGRLCPVETSEGPNIGLILTMASFARINQYGFVETPYLRVKNGKVTKEVDYLSYDEEADKFIAQLDTKVDKDGNILEERVLCRYSTEDTITLVDRDKVDYIDVSSKQCVSVSASLIPFLEHTDANRALTGSNMQRQAVPLIENEAPFIATGVEEKVARDSHAVVVAKDEGDIVAVDSSKIVIQTKQGLQTYHLMNFVRSNHAMSMNQKPLVSIGDKIKAGDIIADGPSTKDGELSIGKNVLVAFMPWGGYNFEDAIVVSERLVKDDVFTSIHIEEYSIEERATKLGDEEITKEIPNISDEALKDIDHRGVIRIGAEVRSGSILVGKITPKGESDPAAEDRLLRAIFGEKARDVRDTSLRLSHGSKGTVVDIVELSKVNGDDLPAGVNRIIKVYIAEKRKLTVGDKMCGRHGNKGIVSRILPIEDMPYLADGRPVDVVLNPLGVPSRMNIGQVLETHLGIAAKELNIYMATPVFDGAKESEIKHYLKKANWPEDGKVVLYDGRTGMPFENRITVGCMYMLKLHHLAEDKMHARSIGPYSLVTQQPLGGKAQFGGQRLGEMEVWVLEAHGVSSILREMLTIKSDDVLGRTKAYEAIIKGGSMPEPSSPESFKVLVREFNSLGLNVDIFDHDDQKIHIDEKQNSKDQDFALELNKDEINS